jgi:hypothetical protein
LALLLVSVSAFAEFREVVKARQEIVTKALAAKPPDLAALRQGLLDIGHVLLIYRGKPYDGALTRESTITIQGRLYFGCAVALDRDQSGPPPEEWIAALSAAAQKEYELYVLRLWFTPPDWVKAERNRLLAQADAELRQGITRLDQRFATLRRSDTGPIAKLLLAPSKPGELTLNLAHTYAGINPLKEIENYVFSVEVKPVRLRDNREYEAAEFDRFAALALIARINVRAYDRNLDGPLQLLVRDVLAPLDDLNRRAGGG